MLRGTSSWGSWGSGGFGSDSKRHGHKTPNGQHSHHCDVHHHGWGHHGDTTFFRKHHEHCPGCRRDRSLGGWGGGGGISALEVVAMFYGGVINTSSTSGKMGWGDDSFDDSRFGNTGWRRCHSNEDPLGQHLNACQAASTKMYDEHCPGCRYDRSMNRQDSTSSTASDVSDIASLFGSKTPKSENKSTPTFFSSSRPTKLAQKSLWD